jgi:hypothetical protein
LIPKPRETENVSLPLLEHPKIIELCGARTSDPIMFATKGQATPFEFETMNLKLCDGSSISR